MKKTFIQSNGYQHILTWLQAQDRNPFSFQKKTWQAYAEGYSGLVVAPTGYGKTFSVFLAVLIDFMNHPEKKSSGLQLIWVTPLRSLAKDIARAMQEAIDSLGLDWTVETRHGDTDAKVKTRQSQSMPEILLMTPESLHLLLAQKNRQRHFKDLKCIVVDEWHEFMSSKRGVMVELAIKFIQHMRPDIRIWGITATIGNVEEAQHVLLFNQEKTIQIKAREEKKIEIISVLPDEVEVLPWAGHLGSQLVEKVIPIIKKSRSTLIFTNTRSQSEMWYQLILTASPDLAGIIALHHSSIDAPIRQWIEEGLGNGQLKVVVTTSSLDLGVDFKPVDTVIQIGSSKGVARFIQRAGRSGHSPFEKSKIYFVPTHSLELIESAALQQAIKDNVIEERHPLILTYDVLVQFMVTIALGGGFKAHTLWTIVQSTHAFHALTPEEWQWCLQFITQGGTIGGQYEDFHKVVKDEEDNYIVKSRRIAMLHRMNIGVIVSDSMMKVKFITGGYIGMVEEYFISKLNIGDKFILAGKVLELVMIKNLEAIVRATKGKAITPSWLGGRLPLSSNLSHYLRQKLSQSLHTKEKEIQFLHPLIQLQAHRSHIPQDDELLIEFIQTREGYHLFVYPFEGRLIHEVMASIIAYRISRLMPISLSMAMNDYGFELYSDTAFNLSEEQIKELFSTQHLNADIYKSINAAEMARHKFRDIAVIAGLVVQNMYGQHKSNKSLHASASTIFKVLEEYDADNLLLKQAYNEVFFQQLEEPRLINAFNRIYHNPIIIQYCNRFTPLSFPIKVDSLRQSLSSEDLLTRIQRLQERAIKD